MKIKVIETKGLPHTLTQTDGKTFRIFARQEKEIDAKLVSPEFHAEAKMGQILLVEVKDEEKNIKTGGNK